MSENKNTNPYAERLAGLARGVGMSAMVLAAVAGLIDVSERSSRVVRMATAQPVFSYAGQESINPLNRVKEEDTAVHMISYGIAQRTPGRTGKQ